MSKMPPVGVCKSTRHIARLGSPSFCRKCTRTCPPSHLVISSFRAVPAAVWVTIPLPLMLGVVSVCCVVVFFSVAMCTELQQVQLSSLSRRRSPSGGPLWCSCIWGTTRQFETPLQGTTTQQTTPTVIPCTCGGQCRCLTKELRLRTQDSSSQSYLTRLLLHF